MILLNRYVPIIIPNPIGNKNIKDCFGSLKKLLIAFRHFSYRLNATNMALPDRPGMMLYIPTMIPLIKLIILKYMPLTFFYKKNKKV